MNTLELLARVTPDHVRYIKLGAGGSWEAASLDQGRLYWGNASDPVDLAASQDWPAVRAHYIAAGIKPGPASSFTREMRDFCGGPDTLWITFARGHLWWAFADTAVLRDAPGAGEGALYRQTIGGWRKADVNGTELAMSDLSSSLTKLSAYRQTICAVGNVDYLLRKLRAEPDPAALAATAARQAYADAVLPLIQHLHQDDFELFTDLLFTAMGWRRVSALGGTMKDIDLIVALPATGARASIQVKSAATQAVLDSCVAAFEAGGIGDAFYFVCHTAPGALTTAARSNVHLMVGTDLAEAAVRHGMGDWLLQRAG